MDISATANIARRIRGRIIEMSHAARAAHLGSALSCVDILVALYWHVMTIDPKCPDDPKRDRFILSKGHAAMALFAVLAARGFFPESLLDTFGVVGSCLEEHPSPGCAPGVEAAAGSLGHGIGLGIGMALAGRLQNIPFRVFVTVSDGECNEGSTWEAAMFASIHTLSNLCVIVDFNKWQATGRSCEIMSLEPLADKWRAFGWTAHEVDGHDINILAAHLRQIPAQEGKPVAIIAHTVKGKGISFMEDDNNWHYRIPTEDEVRAAKKELGSP